MLANKVEDIDSNVRSALARKLTPLQSLNWTQRGACSVVGSGPSLKENWGKLKNFKGDIMACNAAYQFLLGKGITPKYMMCFDADPLMLEFITPHPEITFLISSRCPPKTFDLLEGCNVVCWHASGDPNIEAILQKAGRFEDPMVIGGTAAVTRAMVLAQTLGYTEIHLWGADSSFNKGETHIRQSTTVEKRMVVNVGAKVFEVAPWMTQQAEDFKILGPQLRDMFGVKLIVHGTGLIPHIARIMGFETHIEPNWKYQARYIAQSISWKARTLWNHL